MGTPKTLRQAIANGVAEAERTGLDMQLAIRHHVEDFLRQGLQVAMFMDQRTADKLTCMFIERNDEDEQRSA